MKRGGLAEAAVVAPRAPRLPPFLARGLTGRPECCCSACCRRSGWAWGAGGRRVGAVRSRCRPYRHPSFSHLVAMRRPCARPTAGAAAAASRSTTSAARIGDASRAAGGRRLDYGSCRAGRAARPGAAGGRRKEPDKSGAPRRAAPSAGAAQQSLPPASRRARPARARPDTDPNRRHRGVPAHQRDPGDPRVRDGASLARARLGEPDRHPAQPVRWWKSESGGGGRAGRGRHAPRLTPRRPTRLLPPPAAARTSRCARSTTRPKPCPTSRPAPLRPPRARGTCRSTARGASNCLASRRTCLRAWRPPTLMMETLPR